MIVLDQNTPDLFDVIMMFFLQIRNNYLLSARGCYILFLV